MKRTLIFLAGMFFLLGVSGAMAQEMRSSSPEAVPAASPSQIECSGFINPTIMPNDVYVAGGADNEFLDKLHAFTEGDDIYLMTRSGPAPTVGAEYRLVRRANESKAAEFARTGLGPLTTFGFNSYFPGQPGAIRKLGTPYEDIGRAKVIQVTPQAAIAEITFACTTVNFNDLAIPYQPRPIPTYTPTTHLDRFVVLTKNGSGWVTAATHDGSTLADGDIGYISLGSSSGARPGEKFRVIRTLYRLTIPWSVYHPLPPETVGEVVVLWTLDKSSVVTVVSTTSGVNVGDAVEPE